MKFKLSSPGTSFSAKSLLEDYPDLDDFEIEIVDDKCFIEISDLQELLSLFNVENVETGYLIKDYGIVMNENEISIYDDYGA